MYECNNHCPFLSVLVQELFSHSFLPWGLTNHLWDEYHNIINLVSKQIIWNSPWSIVNDKLSHVFYFVIPHHHSLVHGFTSYDLYPVCFLGHVLTGSLSYYLVISYVFSLVHSHCLDIFFYSVIGGFCHAFPGDLSPHVCLVMYWRKLCCSLSTC